MANLAVTLTLHSQNHTAVSLWSLVLRGMKGDFAETAAFCKTLDTIICVDTSIVHLAGSVGSEVFLLLGEVADSRWHAKSRTTPWYKNITILRKNRKSDYPELLHKAQMLISQKRELKTA
jgi:ADP-heptose:LPS heptosyltransferase